MFIVHCSCSLFIVPTVLLSSLMMFFDQHCYQHFDHHCYQHFDHHGLPDNDRLRSACLLWFMEREEGGSRDKVRRLRNSHDDHDLDDNHDGHDGFFN